MKVSQSVVNIGDTFNQWYTSWKPGLKFRLAWEDYYVNSSNGVINIAWNDFAGKEMLKRSLENIRIWKRGKNIDFYSPIDTPIETHWAKSLSQLVQKIYKNEVLPKLKESIWSQEVVWERDNTKNTISWTLLED